MWDLRSLLQHVGSWFSGQGLNPGPPAVEAWTLKPLDCQGSPSENVFMCLLQHLFILISQPHLYCVSNCGCGVR